MPIYEFACSSVECGARGARHEKYFPHMDAIMPDCESCGQRTSMLVSRSHPVFTRPLVEYGDKNRETYYKDLAAGGHWVYRKRSGGGTEDRPIPEFITSDAQQKRYCRDEGLFQPGEVGNVEVHSDGVGCTSQGMPGSWA